MDLPAGPSRERSRSPKGVTKRNILLDAELLDLLENDKQLSSDEEIDDEHVENSDDSDSDDEENEGDDLQSIVNTDFVDAEGNNVSQVLSEVNSPTNVNWFTDPPNIVNFEFTATPGLKSLPNGDKPIDYFNLLVIGKLLDLLVEETSVYATEFFLNTAFDKDRIYEWVNIDRVKMKTFLSLLFHMGVIQMPRLEDQWKTSKLFNLTIFSFIRVYEQKSVYFITPSVSFFTQPC